MSSKLNIAGFGEEIANLEYNGFWDWFVAYVEPANMWRAHKSYIFCEAVFIIGGILIFFHSLKQGGRWPFFYFATIFHGFTVELMAYFFPHIDNFWHAQGIFTFVERRLPLYVVFLYPVFYYHSSWAMSKMKLKCQYAEHLAVGLMTVLIDMPYDIIGIKYLHWIWHDTDPNVADRHYWVPWNSYYFHVCFSASFQFFFHKTRSWLDKRDLGKWERGTISSELIAIVVSALFSMPGGCLLFIPLYHPLHDFLGVPSEVTSVTILIVFTSIVWKFDRKSNRYSEPPKMNFLSKLLIFHLICHYAVQLYTAAFINPKDMISVGLHERIGNCHEMVPVETVLKTLQKRKYLCVTDYDEKYYDFHCLPDQKPPSNNSVWYTICGTDYENKAELLTVLSLISFVAFMVFRSLHFDYDQRITVRLSAKERENLERPPGQKKKLKKQ